MALRNPVICDLFALGCSPHSQLELQEAHSIPDEASGVATVRGSIFEAEIPATPHFWLTDKLHTQLGDPTEPSKSPKV